LHAPEIFSSEELEYFSSLRFDARRSSFLLGRYAAKCAAAHFLNEKDLSRVVIERGVFNQPLVRFLSIHVPGVSISHSDKRAVAVAFPLGTPIGVDLECIDQKRLRAVRSQLTDNEQKIILSNAKDETNASFQLWSIKEALSKIMLCGLMMPFKLIEIEKPVFFEDGRIECEFDNFSQYKGYSMPAQGYSFAFVLPKKLEITTGLDTIFLS
jgi:phosphopantetheinyl transferase